MFQPRFDGYGQPPHQHQHAAPPRPMLHPHLSAPNLQQFMPHGPPPNSIPSNGPPRAFFGPAGGLTPMASPTPHPSTWPFHVSPASPFNPHPPALRPPLPASSYAHRPGLGDGGSVSFGPGASPWPVPGLPPSWAPPTPLSPKNLQALAPKLYPSATSPAPSTIADAARIPATDFRRPSFVPPGLLGNGATGAISPASVASPSSSPEKLQQRQPLPTGGLQIPQPAIPRAPSTPGTPATGLLPLKKKKVRVNFPLEAAAAAAEGAEVISSEPGSKQSTWSRRPERVSLQALAYAAMNPGWEHEEPDHTRDAWPEDEGLGRQPLPDTIDIYLPGKSAWDDFRAEVMEETLRSLGINVDREGLDEDALRQQLRSYTLAHPEVSVHPLLAGLVLNAVPSPRPSPVLPVHSPFGPPSSGPTHDLPVPRGHSSTMSLALPPHSSSWLSPGFPSSPWAPATPMVEEEAHEEPFEQERQPLKPTAAAFVPSGGLKVEAKEFRPAWAAASDGSAGAEQPSQEEKLEGDGKDEVVTDSDAAEEVARADDDDGEASIVTDSDAVDPDLQGGLSHDGTSTGSGSDEEGDDDVPLAELSSRRQHRVSVIDFGYEGGDDSPVDVDIDEERASEYSNPSDEERARHRRLRAGEETGTSGARRGRGAYLDSIDTKVGDGPSSQAEHWLVEESSLRETAEGKEPEESFDRTTDVDELNSFVSTELRRASSTAFRARPLPPLPDEASPSTRSSPVDPVGAASRADSSIDFVHNQSSPMTAATVGRAAGRKSLNVLAGEFNPTSPRSAPPPTFTFEPPEGGPRMPPMLPALELSPFAGPPTSASKRVKLELDEGAIHDQASNTTTPRLLFPNEGPSEERQGRDNMKTFKFPPGPIKPLPVPTTQGTAPTAFNYQGPIRMLPAIPKQASSTSLRGAAAPIDASRGPFDEVQAAMAMPMSPTQTVPRPASVYELIPTQPGLGPVRRIVSSSGLRRLEDERRDDLGAWPVQRSKSEAVDRPSLPRLEILPSSTTPNESARWQREDLHTPYASTDGFLVSAGSAGKTIPVIVRGEGAGIGAASSPSFPRSPADARFEGETARTEYSSSEVEPEKEVAGEGGVAEVLERELGGLRDEVRGLNSLRMEWNSITRDALVDALTDRLNETLGRWSEAFKSASVEAGAGGTVVRGEWDVDEVTDKLAEAVKPHITALIDLASDKKETASLIVAALEPVLAQRGGIDGAVVDELIDRIEAEELKDRLNGLATRMDECVRANADDVRHLDLRFDGLLAALEGNTQRELERARSERDRAVQEGEAARGARQVSEATTQSLRDAVAEADKRSGALQQENEELRGKVAALLAQEAAKDAKEAQLVESSGALQTRVRVLEADAVAYKRQVEIATSSYEGLRKEHAEEVAKWRAREDEMRQEGRKREQEEREARKDERRELKQALDVKAGLEGQIVALEKRIASQDEKLTALQRAAAAKQQSHASASQRVAELEKQTKDLDRLRQEASSLSVDAARAAQLAEELDVAKARAATLEAQNQVFREERDATRRDVERMHETVRSELAESARRCAQAVERGELATMEAERLRRHLDALGPTDQTRQAERHPTGYAAYPSPPQTRPRKASTASSAGSHGTVKSFGASRRASPTPSRSSVASRVSVDENGWWS